MAVKKKDGGGSKLSRSEVVTIRLDPKLRYGVELAARKHRRTASSFIEWAVDRAFEQTEVRNYKGTPYTIARALDEIWDVDETERLVLLALRFPDLLSHDEERIWKVIASNPYFWHCRQLQDGRLRWDLEYRYLIPRHLREKWTTINQVAQGELSEDALPQDQPGKLLKSSFNKLPPRRRI